MKKMGALEGEEARYYYQNSVFDSAESWFVRPTPT